MSRQIRSHATEVHTSKLPVRPTSTRTVPSKRLQPSASERPRIRGPTERPSVIGLPHHMTRIPDRHRLSTPGQSNTHIITKVTFSTANSTDHHRHHTGRHTSSGYRMLANTAHTNIRGYIGGNTNRRFVTVTL